MAKVLRSIRVEDSVFDYIDCYNDLRFRLGLPRVPIGDLISDSVCIYLSQRIVELRRQAARVSDDAQRLSDQLSEQVPVS